MDGNLLQYIHTYATIPASARHASKTTFLDSPTAAPLQWVQLLTHYPILNLSTLSKFRAEKSTGAKSKKVVHLQNAVFS
jgi:hypothetical protein